MMKHGQLSGSHDPGPASEVRRQVLRGIQTGNGSKEFLHAYFATMMRCTQDVTSKTQGKCVGGPGSVQMDLVVPNSHCTRRSTFLRYLSRGLTTPTRQCLQAAVLPSKRAAARCRWKLSQIAHRSSIRFPSCHGTLAQCGACRPRSCCSSTESTTPARGM